MSESEKTNNDEKSFESFSLDINGNAVNYNTNLPIAVYSGVFIVLSKDKEHVKRVLYPSDFPISLLKNIIAKIQNAFIRDSNDKKIKVINPKVEKLSVASFHEDISSLHPETKVGSLFIDAYDNIFGIISIQENYIEFSASIGDDNSILVKSRKDAYGLIQRLNNHTYIGESEFAKELILNKDKNNIETIED